MIPELQLGINYLFILLSNYTIMEKTLWQIIKGSFKGSDGEGSAKRIATWHFMILLTALTGAYIYEFHFSTHSEAPTEIQIKIVDMFTIVVYSYLITVWLLLGLATLEWITYLVRSIKGESATAPIDPAQTTTTTTTETKIN
jgi:hypothetical protein